MVSLHLWSPSNPTWETEVPIAMALALAYSLLVRGTEQAPQGGAPSEQGWGPG